MTSRTFTATEYADPPARRPAEDYLRRPTQRCTGRRPLRSFSQSYTSWRAVGAGERQAVSWRMNTEMLALTLSEYLEASRVCLEYENGENWPGPGSLGFPAGLLLFSVVDAIGSYPRGSPEAFDVDGTKKPIKRTGFQHFFVLNGDDYYGQELTQREIELLYREYRSLLVHNALFTPHGFLAMYATPELFPRENGRLGVNLTAFHTKSVDVVERFLASHPDLHESKVMRHIRRGAS